MGHLGWWHFPPAATRAAAAAGRLGVRAKGKEIDGFGREQERRWQKKKNMKEEEGGRGGCRNGEWAGNIDGGLGRNTGEEQNHVVSF